ncbi:hypothetical protein A6770_24615 [Nostoc minutum NIES-26]|uniref:Uncharacterized protein n=1 Tax=Nostoc minutum NIES-26 TaxID=1844469 RepID=A0A367QVH0_9NOSO|nr:hypothetical protein A6770_24615 [Nostoc minutum NIES-26]
MFAYFILFIALAKNFIGFLVIRTSQNQGDRIFHHCYDKTTTFASTLSNYYQIWIGFVCIAPDC